MKRNVCVSCVYMALVMCVSALMISCPSANTSGVIPEEPTDTVKLNSKGQRVVHTMWGEPEEDPRQVIGYQLENSGIKYFDHYVMLYGLRLRDHDCANDSQKDCNLTGLHLCFANKVKKYYIDGYDTYLKPVREAGIKVILSIVPQYSGVCVGTLYRWPMEEWWPWEDYYKEEYPYGEEAVKGLLDQLKELYRICPFDGIGYDEEYGIQEGVGDQGRGMVYPEAKNYPGIRVNDAWKIGGENMLRFMYEVNEALGMDMIHESYNIRYSPYIPESYEYDGKILNRNELLDYHYNSNYGGFAAKSGDRSTYGPMAISICDTAANGAPRPPKGETLTGYLDQHLRGNYGVVMYYCLRSRDEIKTNFTGYFAGSSNPEDYFSVISNKLHGENTVYLGPDYPRVWTGGGDDPE